jgi:hypothetical protein
MVNQILGIIRRAYYLFAVILSTGALISFVVEIVQSNRTNYDALQIGLFTLPVAFLIHKMCHWVIWGTFK